MSSNVITVNPRKKTARSPPPSRNISSEALDKPGTVLLRNPLPKYSFETKYTSKKKQPKENTTSDKPQLQESPKASEVSADAKATSQPNVIPSGANVNVTSNPPSTVSIPDRDDPGIGRLVNSFPQAMVTQELTHTETQSVNNGTSKTESAEISKMEKPVNKVDPFSSSETRTLNHSVSAPAIDMQSRTTGSQSQPCSVSQTSQSQTSSQVESGNIATGADAETSLGDAVEDSRVAGTSTIPELASYKEKVRRLEDEKQLLKNQLDVQLQVNQELKKLLVASVGEDLHRRVERLMTDRAQMSLELGDFSKKMTEDYEHLDKISIQADMWRSKYLACRVMSDELAASKAFYSMQFQECQMALQQLLSERHELKANLYDSYRGLQQIQEAFDPLNTQNATPRTLTSKHIIELARSNQLLVDRIKFRLLPSHVTSSLSNKMEPDWHDYLTQAESHAQQLLSRELRPEDFRCLPQHSTTTAAIMAPGCLAVDRYHPFANYDNLTLNVCCQCKGDISIV